MTKSQQSWIYSGQKNPCPICGRVKDRDCRISSDGQRVICHHSKDLRQGEVINGWAFTSNIDGDRAGHFVVHTPLTKVDKLSLRSSQKVLPLRPRAQKPAPIDGPIELAAMSEPWPTPPPGHLPDGHRIDYSPTQWTEIKDRGERPRHNLVGKTEYTAGPEPWPLFASGLIPSASGKWIAAAEGPKCALWLQAGGVVAVSQPGHDHKAESITRRFRELVAADVRGLVYLADNDNTGRKKADQIMKCAAEAGLPLLVLHAADVWPGLPDKGSIDDAPGTAEERVKAIRDVIPDAVRLYQKQQETAAADQALTLDDVLRHAEEAKLRRPRTDKLTQVVALLLHLRYNLLSNRIELNGEPIHGDYLSSLYLELAENHAIDVSKERAIDAAMRVAHQNSYHPVQDYLNGITVQLSSEEWASLDLLCFGREDPSGWGLIHLQRQLIGLVARAQKPGCELHTCLVLQSDEQGIGKSRFWKVLGGPWFSDSLGDLRDVREDRLQLHSAWIHEWGEIDNVMGKRESETLKRFITSSRDDVRRPYGRGTEQLLRSCGLVGTTNRRDFIKDPTGNRRFPILQVKTVNLDWVGENRDRIWGSAMAAYKSGKSWHYSSEEARMVSAQAMEYAAADPLREALESWAEDHPDVDEMPALRILCDLQAKCPEYWERRRDREFMRQVGLALTALKFRAMNGQRVRYLLPNGERTDKVTLWKRP